MAQSKYKVSVSDRARRMLGEHVRFLAQVSPTAARKVKTELLAAIRSLDRTPERYPFLDMEPVPRGKYRKLFVEKQYLILYQIKEQTVFVDYIVDCRQDYAWLIH